MSGCAFLFLSLTESDSVFVSVNFFQENVDRCACCLEFGVSNVVLVVCTCGGCATGYRHCVIASHFCKTQLQLKSSLLQNVGGQQFRQTTDWPATKCGPG